jgi:hypothetical protein
MKIKNIKIVDWLWVAYPVLVVVGIFVGMAILFGEDGQRIADIQGAHERLEEEKVQLAKLQQKEKLLKNVDIERETATLTHLTETMPSTKKVWLLVSELAESGKLAGVVMTDINGKIGDVKEASEAGVEVAVAPGVSNNLSIETEFQVSDFGQIKMMVEKLAHLIPLVKVNRVSFEKDKVTFVAEGAWSNWNKISAESQNPLPDITAEVSKIEAKLADFETLPQVGTGAGEFIQTVNPF